MEHIMTNVITRFAAFALIGGALLSGAAAQAESYPRVVGSGENASVEYGPGPARNIVGGALTRVVGSGESATTVVIDAPLAQQPRAGLVPVTIGSGGNLSVACIAA
jgi:hypothetical protein